MFVLAAISGCQSSNKDSKAKSKSKAEVPEVMPSSLVALQNAKKKWSSNSKQYYTIQSQRICECLPEMSALMQISVLDNSILTAIDTASGEVISKEVQKQVRYSREYICSD